MLLCNYFGTSIHNTNPKNVQYVCACVHIGVSGLFVQSLFSFQAWPTSYCTVVLILYECATACSGHCRSTHLLSHIHSTGGQQGAWPASTAETQFDYTVVHLEDISTAFSTNLQLLNESLKQRLAMIDTSTVKCKKLSHRFLKNALCDLLKCYAAKVGNLNLAPFPQAETCLC